MKNMRRLQNLLKSKSRVSHVKKSFHSETNFINISRTASRRSELRKSRNLRKKKNSEKLIMIKSIIVKSTAFTTNKNYELIFRKWNYVEALIKLKSNLQTNDDYVCLNIDIDAFLTDKQFVLKRLLKAHVHLMINFLIVRNIETNVHETKKYVNFSIYLSSRMILSSWSKFIENCISWKNWKSTCWLKTTYWDRKKLS